MTDIDKNLKALQRIHSRLQTTKNEDLEELVHKLLPKLLSYADNEIISIRDEAVSIVMYILNRSKSLQLTLPCTSLIDLLGWDIKPFACNLNLACLDAGILLIKTKEDRISCCRSIFHALYRLNNGNNDNNDDDNGLQKRQFNALCMYAFYCLPVLVEAMNLELENEKENDTENENENENDTENQKQREAVWKSARESISSFFLDISFAVVEAPLVMITASAVGSISPGLSAERVTRLCVSKDSGGWTFQELREAKLNIIEKLFASASKKKERNVFPCPHVVAMAAVLSCDKDSRVSSQAMYKLNGARTFIDNSVLSGDNTQPPEREVLEFLLQLCSPAPTVETETGFISEGRQPLRVTVRSKILHWIIKQYCSSVNGNMSSSQNSGPNNGVKYETHLIAHYSAILELSKELSKSALLERDASKYTLASQSLQLALGLLNQLNMVNTQHRESGSAAGTAVNNLLNSACQLLLHVSMEILKGQESGSDMSQLTADACKVATLVATAKPSYVSNNIILLRSLFACLNKISISDNSAPMDVNYTSELCGCVDAVRKAFESRFRLEYKNKVQSAESEEIKREVAQLVSDCVQLQGTSSSGSSSSSSSSSSNSTQTQQKLLALRWVDTKYVFLSDSTVPLRLLLTLADDDSSIVSSASTRQLDQLRVSLLKSQDENGNQDEIFTPMTTDITVHVDADERDLKSITDRIELMVRELIQGPWLAAGRVACLHLLRCLEAIALAWLRADRVRTICELPFTGTRIWLDYLKTNMSDKGSPSCPVSADLSLATAVALTNVKLPEWNKDLSLDQFLDSEKQLHADVERAALRVLSLSTLMFVHQELINGSGHLNPEVLNQLDSIRSHLVIECLKSGSPDASLVGAENIYAEAQRETRQASVIGLVSLLRLHDIRNETSVVDRVITSMTEVHKESEMSMAVIAAAVEAGAVGSVQFMDLAQPFLLSLSSSDKAQKVSSATVYYMISGVFESGTLDKCIPVWLLELLAKPELRRRVDNAPNEEMHTIAARVDLLSRIRTCWQIRNITVAKMNDELLAYYSQVNCDHYKQTVEVWKAEDSEEGKVNDSQLTASTMEALSRATATVREAIYLGPSLLDSLLVCLEKGAAAVRKSGDHLQRNGEGMSALDICCCALLLSKHLDKLRGFIKITEVRRLVRTLASLLASTEIFENNSATNTDANSNNNQGIQQQVENTINSLINGDANGANDGGGINNTTNEGPNGEAAAASDNNNNNVSANNMSASALDLLLIQDLSSYGICRAHKFARSITDDEGVVKSIEEEVVQLLTKHQSRSKAPTQLHGSSSRNGGDNNNTGDNNDSAGNEDHTINLGGNGDETGDRLAAAVARDTIRTLSGALAATANLNPSAGRNPTTAGGFGVHSSVSRLAKMTNDATVVFALLSITRRHPSFGSNSVLESHALRNIRPPQPPSIPQDKVASIAPRLYLALYDPQSSVRRIMRALWRMLLLNEDAESIAASVATVGNAAADGEALTGAASTNSDIDPHAPLMRLKRDINTPTATSDSIPSKTKLQRIIMTLGSNALESQNWRDREAGSLMLYTYIPKYLVTYRNHGDSNEEDSNNRGLDLLGNPETMSGNEDMVEQPQPSELLCDLWKRGLRVMDDIRDSTRRAGLSLMKVLADVLLRAIGEQQTQETSRPNSGEGIGRSQIFVPPAASRVRAALAFLVPEILERGLPASSPEIRGFSMGILLRIVKASSSHRYGRSRPQATGESGENPMMGLDGLGINMNGDVDAAVQAAGGWTQVAERAQQLASLLNEEMPDVASMLGALPQQLLGANDSLNDNNSDRQRTGPPTTAQAQSPNQNNQHGRSGQGRGYERRHRGGSVFASAVIRTELRRRGWLVDILDRLVEAVSALEPKALQYMSMNTARLNLSEEELEAMRVRLSQQSPLQEAIDYCIRATCEDAGTSEGDHALRMVLHRLSSQAARGVGQMTRMAAARGLAAIGEHLAATAVAAAHVQVSTSSSSTSNAHSDAGIGTNSGSNSTSADPGEVLLSEGTEAAAGTALRALLRHLGEGSSGYDSAASSVYLNVAMGKTTSRTSGFHSLRSALTAAVGALARVAPCELVGVICGDIGVQYESLVGAAEDGYSKELMVDLDLEEQVQDDNNTSMDVEKENNIDEMSIDSGSPSPSSPTKNNIKSSTFASKYQDYEDTSQALSSALSQLLSRAGERTGALSRGIWLRLTACAYVASFEVDPSVTAYQRASIGGGTLGGGVLGEDFQDNFSNATSINSGPNYWAKVFSDCLIGSGAGTKLSALMATYIDTTSTKDVQTKAHTVLEDVLCLVCALLRHPQWARRLHGLAVLRDLLGCVPISTQTTPITTTPSSIPTPIDISNSTSSTHSGEDTTTATNSISSDNGSSAVGAAERFRKALRIATAPVVVRLLALLAGGQWVGQAQVVETLVQLLVACDKYSESKTTATCALPLSSCIILTNSDRVSMATSSSSSSSADNVNSDSVSDIHFAQSLLVSVYSSSSASPSISVAAAGSKHLLSDTEGVDAGAGAVHHVNDVLPLTALKSRATIRSFLIKAPSRSFVNTSTSVDSNVSSKEKVTWAVSARGLLRLLLHELQSSSNNGSGSGSNIQYRLGVARALAALPWSNEALRSQYFAHVSEMLQLAEVNLTGRELEATPSNVNITDLDVEKEIETVIEKEEKKGSLRVPGKNANGSIMFGGRYANHVPASAQPMTKRRTVVGSSRSRSENAANTTTNNIDNSNNSNNGNNNNNNDKSGVASQPAAFRAKVLECLAAGWTATTTTTATTATTATTDVDVSEVVRWATGTVIRENSWSVRKAALMLGASATSSIFSGVATLNASSNSNNSNCSSNISNVVMPPATAADLMLGACAAALKDSKHSKLRQAAVKSLQTLMMASTSTLRNNMSSSPSLNEDQHSMFMMTLNVERRRVLMEELLASARNDADPDVKTVAAAAFAEWKRCALLLSMNSK